jgi:hypothetical protein
MPVKQRELIMWLAWPQERKCEILLEMKLSLD